MVLFFLDFQCPTWGFSIGLQISWDFQSWDFLSGDFHIQSFFQTVGYRYLFHVFICFAANKIDIAVINVEET